MPGARPLASCRAVLILLLLFPLGAQARTGDLQARLAELLGAPAWQGARVGVLALRLDGQVLLERDADLRLVPASGLKVVTAAGALRALGAEHRFRTSLLADGPLRGPVLEGDLVLQGGGDPTLSAGDLQALAGGAAACGLRRVRGRLVADPGPPSPPFGPGWAWEDVPAGFSAEVSGLTVDRGRFDLLLRPGSVGEPPLVAGPPALDCLGLQNQARTVAAGQPSTWELLRLPGRPGTLLVGDIPADEAPEPTSVSVPDPALCAGRAALAALRQRGIGVEGPVVVGRGRGTLLASHDSEPLPGILEDALAESDNLVMEVLFRAAPGASAGLDLPEASARIVDGSGLSRYNLLTARAMVHVLATTPELVALLPRNGQGTLRGRLGDGAAAGRVRAKTGSMGGVSCLAGYLDPDQPERTVAFAVISNGFVAAGRDVKALEDALVQALAEPGGVRPSIGKPAP